MEHKQLLEIEQIRINIDKLSAETQRLNRENRLGFLALPAVATLIGAAMVSLIGALVTVTVALVRATSGG